MSTNLPEKVKQLPADKQKEVEDFIDYLLYKYRGDEMENIAEKRKRNLGRLKGEIRMAENFNDTPEDFKDYMQCLYCWKRKIIIWLEERPANITTEVRNEILAESNVFFSKASVWEMTIKIKTGKLTLKQNLSLFINNANQELNR